MDPTYIRPHSPATENKAGTAAPSVLAFARAFVGVGYSIIPVRTNGTKRPAIYWKPFQSRRATVFELRNWFGAAHPPGIALVHGPVSGNSEALDFDDESVGFEFYATALVLVPALRGAPWVRTPRPGYQLFYRLFSPPLGNQKLACLPHVEAQGGVNVVTTYKAVIETRGSGGYTLAIGSPPACHPRNLPYELVSGSFRNTPRLTDLERAMLIDLARTFDRQPEGEDRDHRDMVIRDADSQHSTDGNTQSKNVGSRPGDEYARATSWRSILTGHGWAKCYSRGTTDYWARPGKKKAEGHSASTNYKATDLMYVFSSNASPFQAGKTYSKFAAFALLCCNGDYSEAAKRLASAGYGERVVDKRAK